MKNTKVLIMFEVAKYTVTEVKSLTKHKSKGNRIVRHYTEICKN
jgi:hypothetical protein